jgi:hypothetical protein
MSDSHQQTAGVNALLADPRIYEMLAKIVSQTDQRGWAFLNLGTIRERSDLETLVAANLIEITDSDVRADQATGRLKRGEIICRSTGAGAEALNSSRHND